MLPMISRTAQARSATNALLSIAVACGAATACRSGGAITQDEPAGVRAPPRVAADAGASGEAAPGDAAARPADASSADAARGASSLDASSPSPGPYGELPEVDPMLAQRVAGYSKDDRYLGYAISTCDPCPTELHFVPKAGPELSFSYFYQPDLPNDVQERRRKAHDADVDRRLTALGVAKVEEGRALRGPFPADLRFAVKSTRDDAKGTVTLHFGARASAGPAVYPMRVVLGPHPMFEPPKDVRAGMAKLSEAERARATKDWRDQWPMSDPELAYANVTRDGKEIGVVAVARGSMWFEAGAVLRMPVDRFVAEVRAGASGAPR